MTVDRRESLRTFGAFVAGAATPGQPPSSGGPQTGLLAPVLELVNATEFESMARLVLPPARYQTISGGHRRSFDKMTFRQRLMVYAMDLDLTTELFGYEMFTPIIVGPVANQGDLHADGELGTARGAAAAKAIMVATSESSHPIDQIVSASSEPVWSDGETESLPPASGSFRQLRSIGWSNFKIWPSEIASFLYFSSSSSSNWCCCFACCSQCTAWALEAAALPARTVGPGW